MFEHFFPLFPDATTSGVNLTRSYWDPSTWPIVSSSFPMLFQQPWNIPIITIRDSYLGVLPPRYPKPPTHRAPTQAPTPLPTCWVNQELILLDNGCICCTVRGDLIQSLRRIGIRHSIGQVHLDGILIELTGMADPAPVVYLGWLVG